MDTAITCKGQWRVTPLLRRLVAGAVCLAVVGWLSPLRVGVVRGNSMDPSLHSGQVIAVDLGFYRSNWLAVGDVVLFHGEHGVYVKRVHAVAGQIVTLVREGVGDGDGWVPITREGARRVAASLGSAASPWLRRVPVPAGTFFALGDALHDSEDSRDFGPVPVEQIIGRVLSFSNPGVTGAKAFQATAPTSGEDRPLALAPEELGEIPPTVLPPQMSKRL